MDTAICSLFEELRGSERIVVMRRVRPGPLAPRSNPPEPAAEDPSGRSASTPSDPPGKIEPVSTGDPSWSNDALRRALRLLRRELEPPVYLAFELHVLRRVPAVEVCRRLQIRRRELDRIKWHIIEQLRRELTKSPD